MKSKTEDDVDLISTTSFNPVVDLTSGTTSDEESHQASTPSWIDALLASAATVNEQCGHENDTYATRRRLIEKEDDDSSEEETYDATVKSQGAHQDESLNAIEVWFRDKVHRGHELLGLLALVDFHESNPDKCKVGREICRNLRRKVEVAEQSMGCDWEKTVGPLARAVSAHLADAGENLEDVLERFQDHAKEIEPKPNFDDLMLDNAEYIDRFRPSRKHNIYSTGVERLPSPTPDTSELFLPDRPKTLRSSSCRPHLSPPIAARTPNKAEHSQDLLDLINASTVSRGQQAIYTPGSSSQQDNMCTSRMFSEPKKVHWDIEKKTDTDSGKDLSGDRSEGSDEDDSDEESDQESESDGDEYSDEDDNGEDTEDDYGCTNVRVNQRQIHFLKDILEDHGQQEEPDSYCSGEHEDLEHGLDMCEAFADEMTGEMMIAGVAYEVAKHFYDYGFSPRKTLKSYITSGKNCEWDPWGKEELVAAGKLKPWFRERAWYSDKH
ncbi:hypothetical protein CGLO_13263 [Colletotrichum gloeosporioides Cg-14]|uniref:Uncharacterized protein n=1 Tax=Colletotrichum gloeosporioides (strain Cg-14) TaxID=1237896 RepID=T0K447_COLGC|nr:hypothetical protein CGLO_13263 [Colletotrichum gloeosporioides Cg-14]